MPIVVKPGKYLIEKSRRRLIGVIALVGTGGSVPAPVQAALNSFAASVHPGQASSVHRQERSSLQTALRGKSGLWLVMAPTGVHWAVPDGKGLYEVAAVRAIKHVLRGSGWNPPADQLDRLVWGEEKKK